MVGKQALVVFAMFLSLPGNDAQSKLSPCELTYVPYISGEEFPENGVKVDNDKYVAVALYFSFPSIGFFAGTASKSSKKMTFATFGLSVKTTSSFYILSNPNDCALQWIDAPNGDIPEPEYAVGLLMGGYIAMRKTKGFVMVGTYVISDVSLLYAVDPETGYADEFLAAEVLTATENLKLTLQDFEFTTPLEADQSDVMGFDYIDNNSGVTLEHTILHEKSVIIRHEITESHSFAESTYTRVDMDLDLGVVEIDIEFESIDEKGRGESSSIVNEKEDTVKSMRTIIVPPYVKLEACSILFTAKQSAMPYKGVGVYNIPGRSSSYVKNILKAQNYDESNIFRTNATHVFVKVEGEFSVDTPLRSKLIVHEENDPEGCKEIQKTINSMRRAVVFGKKPKNDTEVISLRAKLDKLLNK